MIGLKLVEVGLEELADTKRNFYWAVNSPKGICPPVDEQSAKRVAPGLSNRLYEYYETFGPNTKAIVWEWE